MATYYEVAIAFASALVDGDFTKAYTFLSPTLKKQMTPKTLRREMESMWSGYAEGKARNIHFDEEFSFKDWPGKLTGDIGWVYVGIEGDHFLEAVTVIVADISGKQLIRDIEWGRP